MVKLDKIWYNFCLKFRQSYRIVFTGEIMEIAQYQEQIKDLHARGQELRGYL